jgi:glucose/arabinose dehydrogenase
MRPALRILALLVTAVLPAALGFPGAAHGADVYDQLQYPSTLKFAPDGRLFCGEVFSGRLFVFADTLATTPSLWATLPVPPSGERGLLGFTFHPQFPDSPYVYIFHTNPSPLFNRVVRMRDSAGVGTHYTILVDSLQAGSAVHAGGRMGFGPDGLLYVTCGDQGVIDNAQDLSNPYGKILRFTSMGRPAPGNPFGSQNPIVAYGVRSPYGFCFDSKTGNAYFTDNGPNCDDELNFYQYAANYGWGPGDPCGGQLPGTKLPMWMVTPTIAPTGVCVYRGSRLPYYDGNLFFGSYNWGTIYRVVLAPSQPDVAQSVQVFTTLPEGALDITEGPDQCLWIATLSTIWRLGADAVLGAEDRLPNALWMPGPSPFTDRVALAARGSVLLRSLAVFDAAGRRVRSFAGPFPVSPVWDGRDESGREVPAGIYLLRAETATGPATRRVVRLAE